MLLKLIINSEKKEYLNIFYCWAIDCIVKDLTNLKIKYNIQKT